MWAQVSGRVRREDMQQGDALNVVGTRQLGQLEVINIGLDTFSVNCPALRAPQTEVSFAHFFHIETID